MSNHFDFLECLLKRNQLLQIATSMEISLDEFEKKNKDNPVIKEKREQIESLKSIYCYIDGLHLAKEVAEKISFENNLVNLQLTNRIKELETENKKLIKTLQHL